MCVTDALRRELCIMKGGPNEINNDRFVDLYAGIFFVDELFWSSTSLRG